MKRAAYLLLLFLMSLNISAQGDACLKGWDMLLLRSRQVHALEADFEQTRTVAVLTRPEVRKGHLSYKAPDRISWQYAGGDQAGESASRLIDTIVQTVLKGDTASLDKSFTRGCTRWEECTWLQLIPKDRRLKPYIQQILLKINTRGDVIEVLVVEKSGDSTRIRMLNLKCY